MASEYAIYALRRAAQNASEKAGHEKALRELGRAGIPAWEVEGDIMRPLTPDERAILESARP